MFSFPRSAGEPRFQPGRRSKRARKRGQNATEKAYSGPKPGAEESAKGYFNRLKPSTLGKSPAHIKAPWRAQKAAKR